jgi:HlyD family secretion protein
MSVKKIIIVVVVLLVVAGIVGLTIMRAQSGYTKVLTGKVKRESLTTVVSGTGQIKPKTYVNVGATAMGRVTHLFVKEGDRVKKGQTVAAIEHVQQEANVSGQQAAIAAANTDIASYIAAEKTAEANVQHAQADLEQKKLDWDRAQGLYKAGILAKQDFDAKKAAYDLDVASVAQADASLSQSKAQTASARGHLGTQVATLRANQDMLNRTIAIAPFDGLVTNQPVREGETVVEGIQNTEGSTLMTIADMSVVTAEVKVDETDIVNVALGQTADVTVDALPGKTFKGHVTEVGDQALLRSTGISTSQSTTGTEEAKDFKVVVTLDSASDDLRPGLSTTAKITTAHKDNTLAIPIQALTMKPAAAPTPGKPHVEETAATTTSAAPAPDQQGVFVIHTDHGKLKVSFVPVKTGITGATEIEVTSGLQDGDEIVTGTYRILRGLKDGTMVKRDTAPVVKDTAEST